MKSLKEYIDESLLADFDDITGEQDKRLFEPISWLYDESLRCKNWNQLLDVVKEFKYVLDIKGNATELHSRFPRPKTGIYSQFWEPQSSHRFTNRDLLCRIDLNLSDASEFSPADSHAQIVTIGYGKTEGLQLEWVHNKPKWRVCGKDIINKLVKNEHSIYLIDPKSPIVSSYNAMMKEFNIK